MSKNYARFRKIHGHKAHVKRESSKTEQTIKAGGEQAAKQPWLDKHAIVRFGTRTNGNRVA